ncbi:cytolytic toxin-alpha-like [Garra rufa]|uniref:cytolytic toxin-alpha-like n=1 Tax=Garra rufa TaxID=137080 RepID=UPI003CCE6B92
MIFFFIIAIESEFTVVAALGRPLSLGMLYDCRKDSFIPGVSLWDKKALSGNVVSDPQPHTDVKFSSSDSLSSKSSLLGVSASLKASFMGGLVEVGGSAKYLHDTKSSNAVSRVTMHYSETITFEQLAMFQLGHIPYHQMFDQKTATHATHVVIAVLYGAQAFVVFDRTLSEKEIKQEIDGELKAMVKNIPSFSIDGKGSVNMTEDEYKKVEKIACTFHGDFILEQNPTTCKEAIHTFKKLPTLLKKNPQNVVAQKVWLYPLHPFESKAARLKRKITTSLISNIENAIEELGEAERACNDLLKNIWIDHFIDIKERLQLFQKLISIYKTNLRNAIGTVLPAIRGGEEEEKSLEDILKNHRSSQFNADILNHWLNDVKSELDLLSHHTKSLEGIRFENSDPMTLFFDRDVDVVVCLTFTSLKYEDPYLSALRKSVQSDRLKELDRCNNLPSVKSARKWFNNPSAIVKMIKSLSQFRKFSEHNKDEKGIRFIMSAIPNTSIAGSSIYLYRKSGLIDTQFQPMPKPPPPIVKNVLAQNVSLKLQSSLSREGLQYRVEYKQVKPHCEAEEPWSSRDTYDEDFTLTELESGKHYLIRCRIVDKVGVSEASDTVNAYLHSKCHLNSL